LLTLFTISIYILSSLEDYFFSQKGVELFTRANIFANITSRYIEYSEELIGSTMVDLEIDKEIRAIVTDDEAVVLFDTSEAANLVGKTLLKSVVVNALKGEDAQQRDYEESVGWGLSVAVPMIKDGTIIGVVYLSTSVEDIIIFLADIRTSLFSISILVSFLIGLLSFIMAGVIIGPVQSLINVITKISGGDLKQRVTIKGKDEIAQLGYSFNKMTDKLEQVQEKRQQFISDASHELKTPLSSIKVLSESLLQTPEPDIEIVKEFLYDINGEINRLSRIIDRLLTLTGMDIEDRSLNFTEVNITELINKIHKSLLPLAQKRDIDIRLYVDKDIYIYADEDKIWEAVFNIADNGIKYSYDGGIIRMSINESDKDVIVEIEDNGIGIPESDISRIFERFYRVDKARARETGGTGLGLSIAINAIKLHGGDIVVESLEGQGSRFRIIIPKG
jgi:signal transduction histidine kinase